MGKEELFVVERYHQVVNPHLLVAPSLVDVEVGVCSLFGRGGDLCLLPLGEVELEIGCNPLR